MQRGETVDARMACRCLEPQMSNVLLRFDGNGAITKLRTAGAARKRIKGPVAPVAQQVSRISSARLWSMSR